MPVYSTGGRGQGNGMVAGNAARHKADTVILLCDQWAIEPTQLEGLDIIAWMPIDTDPLSLLFARWLPVATQTTTSLRLVAMTEFGREKLAQEGYDSVVIPHAIDTEVFRPGMRDTWRIANHIPDDLFLISLVGVNDGTPPRKAFPQALQAFARFSQRHDRTGLYVHTEPQHPNGINVARCAKSLGLEGRVVFPPEYELVNGLLGPEYMAGMYRATDVLSAASMGEGFGVPIIEAMACGTPVIGTKCSSMPEIIKPGSGLLVPGVPWWTHLHQSWWAVPDVGELAKAYEAMYRTARTMRKKALAVGQSYATSEVLWRWGEVLG
jgi:glycosyltransferase involved in cell wall biosynthesis